MSDSLGAAPLAPFDPASLTLPPPGTDTGPEAAVAMEEGQQPMKKKRKGKTRITKKQTAAKRARSEEKGGADS